MYYAKIYECESVTNILGKYLGYILAWSDRLSPTPMKFLGAPLTIPWECSCSTTPLILKVECLLVMESSEWPRSGILSGVTTFLGNWKECLRSRGPSRLRGQYCLADVTYDYSFAAANSRSPGWIEWPQENASVWNIIKTVGRSSMYAFTALEMTPTRGWLLLGMAIRTTRFLFEGVKREDTGMHPQLKNIENQRFHKIFARFTHNKKWHDFTRKMSMHHPHPLPQFLI